MTFRLAWLTAFVVACVAPGFAMADVPPRVDVNSMVDAIQGGHADLLDRQLRGRSPAALGPRGQSRLMAAAITSGGAASVKRLIEWGIDPNQGLPMAAACTTVDLLPLVFAASSNAKPAVVDQMLQAGADINGESGGASPLHTALSQGHHSLAQHLLARGAASDRIEPIAGLTTLMQLAVGAKGLSEADLQSLMGALVSRGAPLNAQNSRGSTALHFAVAARNATLVSQLLSTGADPNVRNGRGETALAMATRQQQDRVMALLLKAGAKP